MHTVIIPTDFSDTATNAILYGIALYRNRPTRFVLMHILDDRQPTGSFGGLKERLEQQAEQGLEDLFQRMLASERHPGHEFEKRLVIGETVSQLVGEAHDRHASCIVLGTTGASGLKETLIGSVASGTMKRAHCPVLAVPSAASFKPLEHVVLATDFRPLKDIKAYDYLKDMLTGSSARLTILNIGKEMEMATMEKTMSGITLDKYFEDVPHAYRFLEDVSPHDAIIEFTDGEGADMLAMIRHDYDFLKNLFKRSSVEKVAMHTHTPLLSLPE